MSINLPNLLDPLDPQELIEDQLLILITDFLFKTYPSSPQSRVEVLLNVAEKYSQSSNPDTRVHLARDASLLQETIINLTRQRKRDALCGGCRKEKIRSTSRDITRRILDKCNPSHESGNESRTNLTYTSYAPPIEREDLRLSL